MNEQSLKDRIRNIATEKNIPFNACWKQLLLERFLVRLSSSKNADKFIFKGGFLLSYILEIGRETIDLDFLITKMKAEEKEIRKTFESIISSYSEDGFSFSWNSIESLKHIHMNYPGYRICLNATFSNMKDQIQIDVGVGDVVDPSFKEIQLIKYKKEPFFEDAISLLIYPPETIFAEKLETIISRGEVNSRMKDYHDLLLMLRKPNISNVDKLRSAIISTFSNRKTVLKPIKYEETSLKNIQQFWSSHLRGLGDNAFVYNLPKNISDVIEEINLFMLSRAIIPFINDFCYLKNHINYKCIVLWLDDYGNKPFPERKFVDISGKKIIKLNSDGQVWCQLLDVVNLGKEGKVKYEHNKLYEVILMFISNQTAKTFTSHDFLRKNNFKTELINAKPGKIYKVPGYFLNDWNNRFDPKTNSVYFWFQPTERLSKTIKNKMIMYAKRNKF